ncbi:MAG: ATP-binding protein, partial [Acidimicrobiales bacterium]
MASVRADRLVGRSGELDLLTAMLEHAAIGQPRATLISGDAGVGKTRLVEELTRIAAERSFLVLSGRCADVGGNVPYLPIADALRNAVTRPEAPEPLLKALAHRQILGRLLPDHSGSELADGEVAGITQQQLFGAVLGLLAELAETAPVLLTLEDLHWADRSTRELVTFLSRVLHRESLGLLLSYRTDDLHRGHPLRPVLAELSRLPNVTAVPLGPLDDQAMADHLTALSDGPLEARALKSIITRAEGNAYYAEEILAVSGDGSDLPTSVAELLLSRVQRLSSDAQRVLHAASVAGRRVEDQTLQITCELSGPAYDVAVGEAVAHHLLVPDGTNGYAFRHALLREAAYDDLLSGERTRLHARLAALLASESRPTTLSRTAAELAHHCLASHDIPGAFSASVQAGREAEGLAAPAEAHRHYEQALSLWERTDCPEKRAGVSRGELGFSSAVNASASGDIGRAVHQLRHLVEYLSGTSTEATLLCRAGERLALCLLEAGQKPEATVAAKAAVHALADDHPGWERAQALATYAHILLYSGEAEQAGELAELARQAAQRSASPWIE